MNSDEPACTTGPISRRVEMTRLVGSMLGLGASRAAPLVATLIATFWLDPHDFGQLMAVQAVLAVAIPVAHLGTAFNAIPLLAAQRGRGQDPGPLVGAASALAGIAALVVAGFMFLGADTIARLGFGTPELAGPLALGIPALVLSALWSLQISQLSGLGRHGATALGGLLGTVGAVAGTALGAIIGGLEGCVLGMGLGLLPGWILGAILLGRHRPSAGWQQVLAGAIPMLGVNLTLVPATLVCAGMLGHQAGGTVQLGLFNLANTLRGIIAFAPVQLSIAAMGPLAQAWPSQDRDLAVRRYARRIGGAIIGAGALLLVVTPVVPLVRPAYAAALPILLLAVPCLMVQVANQAVANVLQIAGRPGQILTVTGGYGLVLIGSFWILGPVSGWNLMLAQTIASALATASLLPLAWQSHRVTTTSPPHLGR